MGIGGHWNCATQISLLVVSESLALRVRQSCSPRIKAYSSQKLENSTSKRWIELSPRLRGLFSRAPNNFLLLLPDGEAWSNERAIFRLSCRTGRDDATGPRVMIAIGVVGNSAEQERASIISKVSLTFHLRRRL